MRVVAVVLVVAISLVTSRAALAGPTTFVTFNLLHGGASSGLVGDGEQLEQRLEIATDELRALAPDVIALQEASETWGRGNVAARLGARLGMHHVYAPATSRVFGIGWLGSVVTTLMNFSEGSAILSRYPIVGTEVYDLPRCQRRLDPRIALRAELATPSGSLYVFSTHTTRDDCQVRRVIELARRYASRLPAIVMGDLNTADTSPVMSEVATQPGVVDAFKLGNGRTPGYTVWQRVTASEPMAFRRVDYIFIVSARNEPAHVLASRVVLASPRRLPDGQTLWPSDHYGVLARIDLAGAAGMSRARR